MTPKGETQEFILPVTEEEYETAGSKFITFLDKEGRAVPATEWKKIVGESTFLDVELGMPDWDTPGKSLKFPLSIIEEGPDKGKEDKISAGVDTKGIWKLKEIVKSVLGSDLAMKKGADNKMHPSLNPTAFVGKQAVGQWVMQSGHAGGDPSKPITYYPKLVTLLPPGEKPTVESIL